MSKPDHLQKAHRNLARVMTNEQTIREEARAAGHRPRRISREKLESDIEAFLANGGQVEKVASGQDLPSMAAMTGGF